MSPPGVTPMSPRRNHLKKPLKKGARSKKKPREKKNPPSPLRLLSDYWLEIYAQKYALKYQHKGAADANALKKLVAVAGDDAELAKRALAAYLADDDPFVAKKLHQLRFVGMNPEQYVSKARDRAAGEEPRYPHG